MPEQNPGLTRRGLIKGAAAGTVAMGLAGGLGSEAEAATTNVVPLPTPAEFRGQVQQMVDLGPRLTGYPAHTAFVDHLRDEFQRAGLQLQDCDEYLIDRWVPRKVSLNLLDGPAKGSVKIAFPWVRSKTTGPTGVTGPLVYGGTLPAPSISPHDITSIPAALAAYPAQVGTFVSALSGTPQGLSGGLQGSILVIDVPSPAPVALGAFAPISTYLQWYDKQGNNRPITDWATVDFKRVWFGPYADLSQFESLGIAGLVLIIDASYEACAGSYTNHVGAATPLPMLVVDRDTGAKLRADAATTPRAKLVLDAPTDKVPIRSVTGILPGRSEETIIISSHSDGQNAFEENGALAVVAMARHFASLPPAERPERTLVFAVWPGHMTPDAHVNTVNGWIASHKDMITRAAGAISIEHLGALEWNDSINNGYRATGEKETFATWTTQGPMFDLVKQALVHSKLDRVAMLRPPYMITPGAPFHFAGIPFVGSIAGPDYLLVVSENGEMDKFDATHAARQIAWFTDIVRRIDAVPLAQLRTGDPTLGADIPNVPGYYDGIVTSRSVSCINPKIKPAVSPHRPEEDQPAVHAPPTGSGLAATGPRSAAEILGLAALAAGAAMLRRRSTPDPDTGSERGA